MSAKGIDYFYDYLDMDRSIFKVFYCFDTDTGSTIPSTGLADPLFSGTFLNTNYPSQTPGRAFFDSNDVKINHSDQITSPDWTIIITYEKTTQDEGILFSSSNGSDGFIIGVNSANKLYLQYNDPDPVVKTSSNSFAAANAIAISKYGNTIALCCYNFNSRKLEVENFVIDSEVVNSSDWYVGGSRHSAHPQGVSSFKGYIDHFIYLSGPTNPTDLEELFSGLFMYESDEMGAFTLSGFITKDVRTLNNNVIDSSSIKETLSGDFSYDPSPIVIDDFNKLYDAGDIKDSCGDDFPLNIYDGDTGRFIRGTFYRFTGDVTVVSTEVSAFSYNVDIIPMVVGFSETPVDIGTGVVSSEINEIGHCMDFCGNLITTYEYENATGIISGSNFLPISEVFSGKRDIGGGTFYSSDLEISDVKESCTLAEDAVFIERCNFDSVVYLRDIDDKDMSHVYGVKTSRVNLWQEPSYDKARKKFKIMRPDVSMSNSLFSNGIKQFEGDNYIVDQNYFDGSGAYDINDSLFYDSFLLTERRYEGLTVDFSFVLTDPGKVFNNTDRVFFNGQKLLFETDYTIAGGDIDFFGSELDLPIDGSIVVLSHGLSTTEAFGRQSSFTGLNFVKGGSQLYLNGQRQEINNDYVETSELGLLGNGGDFSETLKKGLSIIYNDDSRFFE